MTRIRRRLLAVLLGPFVIAASLVVLAGPASAAVPLSDTTVTSNHPSSLSGQSVTLVDTLTGTGTTPTGTVSFFDGATPLCAGVTVTETVPGIGQGSCTTAALTVGVHSITATYSGDLTYSPGTSPAFTQTVAAAATTTAIVPSANPSVFSQPVTVTATVTPVAPGGGIPTGSVSFQDATVDITGCTAQPLSAGAATCVLSSLAVASHSLTARYAGTSSYVTSLSTAVDQTVTEAGTQVILTANHNPASSSESVILHATVSVLAPGTATPTGNVAFFRIRDDMTREWIATVPVTAGVATTSTASLPLGVSNLNAVYRGSADFSISSGVLNETINSDGSRTVLTTSRASAKAGRFISFAATVTPSDGTGNPTGTVAFFRMRADDTRQWMGNIQISNGVARLRTNSVPVGTHDIVAVYRGDPSYQISAGGVSQTITP